jgi:hypothetical protein
MPSRTDNVAWIRNDAPTLADRVRTNKLRGGLGKLLLRGLPEAAGE